MVEENEVKQDRVFFSFPVESGESQKESESSDEKGEIDQGMNSWAAGLRPLLQSMVIHRGEFEIAFFNPRLLFNVAGSLWALG